MVLDNLEFILENCDLVPVDVKHIGFFKISDIETLIIGGDACSMSNVDHANCVVIEISKNADIPYHPFGESTFAEESTFRNLRRGDITHIEFDLYKEEGAGAYSAKHFNFSVDWNKDNDQYNSYQKTFVSEAGNLYIVIHKKKNVFNFFDVKSIDKRIVGVRSHV